MLNLLLFKVGGGRKKVAFDAIRASFVPLVDLALI